MKLTYLLALILSGYVAARLLGLIELQQSSWYLLLVTSLLAVGLYASTYGIVLAEAKKHLRIILSAVTIGVFVKALLIGGSLALLFGDPFFFILGVAVAQIDPLSVASLMKGKRLSAKAKTILASWASFDDPVTVILSLYAPLLVAYLAGTSWQTISGGTQVDLVAYLVDVGLNLAFAGAVLAAFLLIRFYARRTYAWVAIMLAAAVYGLLILSLSVSVLYLMMLGIALIGLFLRPTALEKFIPPIITGALSLAAVLLGALMIHGVNIGAGIALGIAAYGSQIIVGLLLTRGFAAHDRWHIALAQQNGITAIILALLFEPIHPGTVAVVAPAIIVVNGLHATVNYFYDKRPFKLLRG